MLPMGVVMYATPALAVGVGSALLEHVFSDPEPAPFLLVLGLFACAGGLARLMYDTATASLTWRQQAGRVLLSVIGALSVAMMLFETVAPRALWLMGFCTALAVAGPGILDAVLWRFVGRGLMAVTPRGEDDPRKDAQ